MALINYNYRMLSSLSSLLLLMYWLL